MMNNVKNFDDLPVTLKAKDIAKVMGICVRTAWNLIHSKGFPMMRVGKRIIIPKEQFIRWLNKQTEEVI